MGIQLNSLMHIDQADASGGRSFLQIICREPYALAGDVSTAKGIEGRGGWSLYTGAAGWYYRTVVEELLGIRLRSGALELEPRLPSGWHGYSATLTLDGAVIAITVSDTAPQGLTVDGEQAERF